MKIITFGELLLRLSPENNLRFFQEPRLQTFFGGCEANVAMFLASLDENTVYISAVPNNAIGISGLRELRKYGVNTDYIVKSGERLGVYFAERGASQRSGRIVYDRTGSSFSTTDAELYNFDEAFSNADWFHFSGITPALSENSKRALSIAIQKARKRGLTVSIDVNYRSNLWSEQEAEKVLCEYMKYVDVCIVNEEQARRVLRAKTLRVGRCDGEYYTELACELCREYGCRAAALTIRRGDSATNNEFSAVLYMEGRAFFSRKYDLHIVDRIGGGDAFSAGLIYALGNNKDGKSAIDFAAAAACLKHSIEGDFNLATKEEIDRLVNGNEIGRVQR